MTPLQRKILKLMRDNYPCFAVKYTLGNKKYYRIISHDRTPLLNAKNRAFKILIKNEFLEKDTSYSIESYKISEKGKSYRFREKIIIKKEPTYSEEEVNFFLNRYRSQFRMDRNVDVKQGDFIQWFDKYKKK